MTSSIAKATLLHRFLHWEEKRGDAVWLIQPQADGSTKAFTWREVGDEARRMAAHLVTLGLPPGSRIGICGKNSAHWIIADLAIWMAGMISVPIFPTLNTEAAAHVIGHAEIRLIFIGKLDGKTDSWPLIAAAIPDDMPCIRLPLAPARDCPAWGDVIAAVPPLMLRDLPHADDVATIIYTSGSTGLPKGVIHSFGTMGAVAAGLEGLYSITPADRMLSYLPLAHAAERAAVESTALYFGFTVYFAWGLETFAADLRRARPTIFFSVPRLWVKFYQTANDRLPPLLQRMVFGAPLLGRLARRRMLGMIGLADVRVAITASAPLPDAILSWYRGLGLELLDCYGMTENFGYSHASKPGQVRIGYVGSPNPGVDCRLSPEGEIEVRSPGQMLGYYKDEGQTAASLTHDGYMRTGDLGEVDAMGRLRVTGRVKDIFKTAKGKYVAPLPIEQALGNSRLVENSCVMGSGEPQPVALVLPSPDGLAALAKADGMAAFEALRREINRGLDPHEKLAALIVVKTPWTIDSGLLTPTMKIKRAAIEKTYGGRLPALTGSGAGVIVID